MNVCHSFPILDFIAYFILEYPKKGRCSVEIIKELDQMVMELLQVFAKRCGNHLPNRIVFYRDGVDEGQYQKVLDHEVTKIKTACRSKSSKMIMQYNFIRFLSYLRK